MDAEQERFVPKQQIDDELQELRADLRLRRQRAATTKRVDGPLLMSTCALTPAERVVLDSMWGDERFTQARVAAKRSRSLEDIGPPPQALQRVLEGFVPRQPQAARAHLPWLSGVCTRHNLFSDSIFRFTVGAHARHEELVYAL